jgi:hypothetical protein
MSKIPYSHYDITLTFQGKTWKRITSFFVKEGTSEEHAVIACYHNVEHSFKLQQLHLQHKIKHSNLQQFQSRGQIIQWKNKDHCFSPFKHYRFFTNFIARLFTLRGI